MATTIQQIELPKKARAVDTSGNNNHGQIYSGRGLEFDGVGDYIHTPLDGNTAVFGDQSDFEVTISFWYNTSAASSDTRGVIQWARTSVVDGSPFILFKQNNNGVLQYYVDEAYSTLSHVFQDETWYRIVLTRTASDNTWRSYVNGIADTVYDDSGSPALQANADSVFFGTGFGGYFAGMLSDAQIWNKPFTQTDVTYDYLNPESLALNNSGTALTESNLKLWYPMQDGHRGQQSYILDGANTGAVVEAVTNGDFANGTTGWSTETGWEIVNSKAVQDGSAVGVGGSGDLVSSGEIFEIGKTYLIQVDVVDYVSGDVDVTSSNISLSVNGDGSYYARYTAATTYLHIRAGYSDFVGSIDNISVKAINDKHHATTVFYGDELVTNGTFASGTTGWDKNTNTTLSVTSEQLDIQSGAGGGVYGYAYSTVNFVQGRTYKIDLDVISTNVASHIRAGSTSSLAGVPTNIWNSGDIGVGSQSITFVAATNETYFAIGGRNDMTTLVIDNVSIKEVGVASGWTDADQQLHIPQTALQSYNELAWFDGTIASDGYVDLDSAITTSGNNWSLSFWVFHDDNSQAFDFIAGNSANQIITLKNNTTDRLSYRDDGNTYHAISDAAIPESEWVNITITATANTSITAYVNGVAQATNSNMTNTTLLLKRFMRGYSSDLYHVFGTINEISYYSDVLTAAEALDLFNDGKAKSALEASGSAGLVGYWRNNGLSEWKNLALVSNAGILAEDLDTTETGVDVDAGHGFLVDDVIVINSEHMLVTAVSTNTLTVVRGYSNTTATTHDNDDSIGVYTNNGTPSAGVTETILIPQGVDSTRDAQGFIMNRQKSTSCFNNTASGGYIEIPVAAVDDDLAFLGVGDGFSVQAWIKINGDNNTDNAMIVSRNNNTDGYRLEYSTAGKISFGIEENGTLKTALADSASSIGAWHHVVGTFDGDPDNDGSGEIKLYLNGETGGSATNNTTVSNDMDTSTSPMRIGKHYWSGAELFDGAIDGVLIYNKVLSLEEVQRNYKATKGNHRN